MNIRSLITALSFEKPAAVQNEDPATATPEITSKGIASVPDSFEGSPRNFFFGKRLEADSFQQEQDYSKGTTFDVSKRYSGVILQEGRVQLDSDSNESTDVKRGSEFLRDSAFTPFKDDD